MNTCVHTDEPEKQNTKWSLKSTVCLDHDPLCPPESDSGIFWFIVLFCLIALFLKVHMLHCMFLIPVFVCAESLSHVRLFVTPWTIACQTPCSWDFSGKNTRVDGHFLLQGILLTQRLNQHLVHYSRFCTIWVIREALMPIVSFSLMRFNKEKPSLGPRRVFTHLRKGHC